MLFAAQKLLLVAVSALTLSLLLVPQYNVANSQPAKSCEKTAAKCDGEGPVRPPTKPRNSVSTDYVIHYHNFGPQDLITVGKAVVYTGGFVIGTKTAVDGVILAAHGGVLPAIPSAITAAPVIIAIGSKWIDQMKQLQGGGTKGDDILYIGKHMKTSNGTPCKITSTFLNLLDHDKNVVQSGRAVSEAGSLPGTHYGASIPEGGSREGGSDPSVDVHWFYDLGTATRYRVVYLVDRPGCSITG